jgi:hypothetical protein
MENMRQPLVSCSCHSRESGNPGFWEAPWIPAFAGMTGIKGFLSGIMEGALR